MARKNTAKMVCDALNANGGAGGLTVREGWALLGRHDIVEGLERREAEIDAASGTKRGENQAARSLAAFKMWAGK